jgi:hypothetical protein
MKKKWKAKEGELFFYPDLKHKFWVETARQVPAGWYYGLYSRGLMCKTYKEARQLARVIYKAVKEVQEKK